MDNLSTLKQRAKSWLARTPSIYRTASAAYRSLNVLQGMAYVAAQAPAIRMGAKPIVVSYSGSPAPRWGHGRPPHRSLNDLIERNRVRYESFIDELGGLRSSFESIPLNRPVGAADSGEFVWENSFFSGLDAAALYGLIARHRPARYVEVGSGNSTRLARRAIRDRALSTTITSIDPAPQAAVDHLCDRVIRQRLEDVSLELFDDLADGDVLFFDGSHYAFMGSDVVVFWLEVLPRIKPGVLIHIHDIFLPFDYPPDWAERHYDEQYLLAVALLAPQCPFDVLFPNHFVISDPALAKRLDEKVGPRAAGSAASFWLRARGR